jgi:hypothetical protein
VKKGTASNVASYATSFAVAAFFLGLAAVQLGLTATALFGVQPFWGHPPPQLAAAWAAALFVFCALAYEAWKGLTPDRALFAAAVCVTATMLLWHENARAFADPAQACPWFFLAAGLIVAMLAVLYAVESGHRAIGFAIALLACAAAAWYSPIGVATFAAVLALAVAVRAGFLVFFVLLLAVVAAAAFYVWMARGVDLNALVAWAQGLAPVATLPIVQIGAVPREMLRTVPLDPAWTFPIAFAVGLLGLVPMAVSCALLWFRHHFFTRLEGLAIGLFAFGVAAHVVIVARGARLFIAHPEELLAPRYLFWSCVTWLGIALFVAARLGFAGPAGRRWGLTALALFSIAAIPG